MTDLECGEAVVHLAPDHLWQLLQIETPPLREHHDVAELDDGVHLPREARHVGGGRPLPLLGQDGVLDALQNIFEGALCQRRAEVADDVLLEELDLVGEVDLALPRGPRRGRGGLLPVRETRLLSLEKILIIICCSSQGTPGKEKGENFAKPGNFLSSTFLREIKAGETLKSV